MTDLRQQPGTPPVPPAHPPEGDAPGSLERFNPQHLPGYGEILRFTVPLMLGMLTIALHTLVDTAFIGRLGTEQLAAHPLAMLTYVCGVVLTIGVMRNAITFIARAYGAGRLQRVGVIVAHYHLLALAGIPVVLLCALAYPLVVAGAGVSGEVADYGAAYLRVRVWDVLFVELFVLYSALYQSIGNSRFPMLVSWGGLALNVLLTWALVFGHLGLPALGMPGAAWATLVSQAAEMAVIVGASYRPALRRRFALVPWARLEPRTLRELVRIGLPQGLGDCLDVATFLLFFIIVGRFGVVPLAASNIGGQVSHMLFMPGMAVGIAVASYVGRYLGGLRPDHARQAVWRGLMVAMIYMGTLGVPLFFLGEPIARIFTANEEVIAQCGLMFRVMAFYQVFDAIGMVLRGALNGAGDTRFVTSVLGAMAVLVMLPVTWVMAHGIDPPLVGAWVGASIYLVILAGVLLARFRGDRWLVQRLAAMDGAGPSPDAA